MANVGVSLMIVWEVGGQSISSGWVAGSLLD